MIALSLLIALLASCGYLVGAPILARLSRGSALEWGTDGAFLSTWLGVVILAAALLAVSLAAPLSPAVAAAVFLGVVLVSVVAGGSGRTVLTWSRVSPAAVLGTAVLILGVAAYCSQVIVWYDTRLYHMQAVKWLSQYGVVPGEALIHERLGFISTWFAPAAAFDHGALEGRTASACGAFCLFMLVAQLLVALGRIARGTGRPTDTFFVAVALPVLAATMVYGLPNSASPDLPVFILVIEGALAMLLVSARGRKDTGAPDTPWNAALVPLLIGAGATAVKLSALPLLVLATIYYAWPKPSLKKMAAAGAVLALFLGPVAAAGIVTSGCAFYPAPYLCLHLPWSLGSAQAAAESALIRDWARWDGPTPVGATSWNWLPSWLAREKACSALLLLSALAAPRLWSRNGRRPAGSPYVVWLASCGIAFMLFAGPTWRFGLAYLVLLPALALAYQKTQPEPAQSSAAWRRYPRNWALMATATALLLATHIYLVPRPTFRALEEAAARMAPGPNQDHPHFNLLRPPRLWHVDFAAAAGTGEKRAAAEAPLFRDAVADVTYFHPDPEQTELCWDGPLPCSPTRLSGIRLRDPASGIAGGFVRAGATGK